MDASDLPSFGTVNSRSKPLRADVRLGDLPFGPLPASSGPTVAGPIRTRRAGVLILLFLAALILAACGGGGDEASPSGSTVIPAAPTEAPDEPDTGSQEAADEPNGNAPEPVAGSLGESRAIVVIDGEQFDFDMSATCISMAGTVGGLGFTADGLVQLNLDIPPEDWETSDEGWEAPAIRIRDERDENAERDWQAGGGVNENYDTGGIARVNTFSTEGGRAFGTATFIDLRAYDLAAALGDPLPDPVTGTFDINCG